MSDKTAMKGVQTKKAIAPEQTRSLCPLCQVSVPTGMVSLQHGAPRRRRPSRLQVAKATDIKRNCPLPSAAASRWHAVHKQRPSCNDRATSMARSQSPRARVVISHRSLLNRPADMTDSRRRGRACGNRIRPMWAQNVPVWARHHKSTAHHLMNFECTHSNTTSLRKDFGTGVRAVRWRQCGRSTIVFLPVLTIHSFEPVEFAPYRQKPSARAISTHSR